MLPIIKRYNSNIRAVGTKIPETIEFLKLYSKHFDISYVKEKIVDDNVFNIGNLRTIKNLFATLKSRYALDNEFYKVKNLTDIANSNLDIEIIKTIIFLYFAQYEYAVFDVMTKCIFPLKQNKFNKLNGSTILSFFSSFSSIKGRVSGTNNPPSSDIPFNMALDAVKFLFKPLVLL